VALFNILEERDVQIRGYRIRLPLDLLLVVTANPEDYTHRGRIVSPLKDRFGTQVRTHYPETLTDEIRIMDQGGGPPAGDAPIRVPRYMEEVLAALTAELRRSPHVNHRSGVSVRYSIGNLETLSAAAVRRAARTGEPEAVPRVCDLPAVLEASLGRVEFDTIEEGREEEVLLRALRTAAPEVFRRRLAGFDFAPILSKFAGGFVARVHEYVGWVVVALFAVGWLWGLVIWIAKRQAGDWFWRWLAVVQVVAVVQALIGIVLLVMGYRPTTWLHYVYGFGPLVLLAIA